MAFPPNGHVVLASALEAPPIPARPRIDISNGKDDLRSILPEIIKVKHLKCSMMPATEQQQHVPTPEPGPPHIPAQFPVGREASATEGYVLNHVALQISSASASLAFYTDFLGMILVFALNAGPFTAYYLGYPAETDSRPADMAATMGSRSGLLELILSHDQPTSSEDQESTKGSGTVDCERKLNHGFAHLGIRVPDVAETLKRAERLGCKVHKFVGDVEVSHMPLPGWDVTKVEDRARRWAGGFERTFAQIGFVKDPDG
ncbi:hypothetical protein LTR10_014524 [Elasticomyces elasticus]|nr:hypothetical protein LTR10_014524 [Elasticomyces elasticus]KAK5043071.1 hypothetical protein LTR13_000842 [Exophiala sideris]